jgi:spore germination protein YaaH
MSKENILLIISTLLFIAIVVFSSYIVFSRIDKKNIHSNEEIEELKEVETTPQQENNTQPIKTEFIYSAWIPAFDFANGYESLKTNKGVINEINPVFYGVNDDGTLLNRKPDETTLKEFLVFCSTQNISVIPTIGSYDYKIIDSVLSSDVYIEKHISEIVSEVNKYNYSGIDIDYERMRTENKDGYFLFLKNLKTELKKHNKALSVTVFAKTRDSLIDTLYLKDWVEIGEIADTVRIMTYDFTLQTSTKPGPIGPLEWINEVLKYSRGKIPSEKISLGIHLYAYLWKGEKASALTNSSVSKILENKNIQREYRQDIGEGYAKYICSDGLECTL